MDTDNNLILEQQRDRARQQIPVLPAVQPNFNAPPSPTDNQPDVPLLQPRAEDTYQPEPKVAPPGFDPLAPLDVSGLRTPDNTIIPTAGSTPLEIQDKLLTPLEQQGQAAVDVAETQRIDEANAPQDLSILNYNPPDIDGQIAEGNARVDALQAELDAQERERAVAATNKYPGQSLQDAMQMLDREPAEGSLAPVFKKVGDYFGGAMFTDPRTGLQYTTPYVALTQRALGLPETQKEGPPNIVGGLLYGLSLIGSAPVAYAKDRLDTIQWAVSKVTDSMPWLKAHQEAQTRWMQRNAPALAAKALENRRQSAARTAPGGTSNITSMLRGANYSLTDEMSTGSIGKIPGTSIDVDPGSLAGFAVDVFTGELVEKALQATVKQATLGAVRTVAVNTLSSRAARRARPGAAPKPGGALARRASTVTGEVEGDVIIAGPAKVVTPAPPKQRALTGTPPAVTAATIPNHRAVVVRPASRGTGKAIITTVPNSLKPVTVVTPQAVPEPNYTQVHRSAPTPKYDQPKPTGSGGQFELDLSNVVPTKIPVSVVDAPVQARSIEGLQLELPGVLPERKQFGMLGVEFYPDNSVVFKGLDDVFEDGDVIEARKFFTELAETGANPTVKLTADLDETAWDNGFINAVHMGFKPVANDGTVFNPNLVEFGSDVVMQLTKPGNARRTDSRTGAEVLGLSSAIVPVRTVADVVERTDSLVYALPSPSARLLDAQIDNVVHAFVDVVDTPDDVSLRTLIGSLEYPDEVLPGNAIARYRLLRDAGVPAKDSTSVRDFGRVRSVISHTYGDTYDIAFKVDGGYTRADGLETIPSRDIADFSKFIMDLHKRNPSATFEASIAATTATEWSTKYKAYTRAGFTPVDELGQPMRMLYTPDLGTPLRLMFDPDNVTSSVLARRIQNTESLISTSAVDADFVELAKATQSRELVLKLLKNAEQLRKKAYDLVVQLPLPSRQVIDELPRRNIETSTSFASVTKQSLDYEEVYHGTRVQAPDVAALDHINGGSTSALSVGFHVTEDSTHALFHASRSVNLDLPRNVQREYGAPSISRYAITSDAYVLNADTPYAEVSDLVREILQEIYVPSVELVPRKLSVKDAIDFVDSELSGEDAMITLFQREFSDGLRAGGVDVIDGGPNARVILNTEVLIADTLNAPVRNAVDTAASATKNERFAALMDDNALNTRRSLRDSIEADYTHAAQEVHEIKNVLNGIDDRIDNAVSQTTLWDYTGVPKDEGVRYADESPVMRSTRTPFNNEPPIDVSPCTL